MNKSIIIFSIFLVTSLCASGQKASLLSDTSMKAHYILSPRLDTHFIVRDSTRTVMEVDSSGIIHVYGDTLTVLKVILDHFKIKHQ